MLLELLVTAEAVHMDCPDGLELQHALLAILTTTTMMMMVVLILVILTLGKQVAC